MSVMTVPAPSLPGTAHPPPPAGPVSPERETQRQIALVGWTAEAQRMLDRCVARGEAERSPVALDVWFAPAAGAAGSSAQQLSPVAISVPVEALRRLWNDTDPDALQACVDRLRTLDLVVPASGRGPVQPLSASAESVLVTL